MPLNEDLTTRLREEGYILCRSLFKRKRDIGRLLLLSAAQIDKIGNELAYAKACIKCQSQEPFSGFDFYPPMAGPTEDSSFPAGTENIYEFRPRK